MTTRINFDEQKILKYGAAVAAEVARLTAYDVKESSGRSMKSGGKETKKAPKSEWTRLGKTSKPGEPPKYHTGGIKKAISVAQDGERGYVVGPKKIAGGAGALKTLEHGGRGRVKTAIYSPSYLSRVKRRPRKAGQTEVSPPCERHGTVRVDRPNAARVYYVGGEKIERYRYFYSRDEWKAARNSPGFLNWANAAKRIETTSPPLAPRPYMAPALRRETSAEKNERRIKNAVAKIAKESAGPTRSRPGARRPNTAKNHKK